MTGAGASASTSLHPGLSTPAVRPRKLSTRLGDGFAAVGEIVILAVRASFAVPRRPLETRAFVRELEVQGNRALGLMIIMSAFTGLVLAYQFGTSMERFGARQYIGNVTALALTREMIPVLTSLVLGGRIVAGIAAELASMAVTEQIDAVRALGADPVKKLVMPRVAATMLVLPVFTILGDVLAGLAGMVVARLEFGVPMRFYLTSMRDSLLVMDFASGVIKSAAFGLVGAVIACHLGMRAKGGTAGVGRATTAAVVASSLAVIVLDYVLTRTLFGVPSVH